MIRLHAFALVVAINLSTSVLLADFTVVKLAESDFARPVFNTFEGSVFFGGEHLPLFPHILFLILWN